MHVYIIIPTQAESPFDSVIESKFDKTNRFRLPNGVWFVCSDHITSSEVVRDIGIEIKKGGIVVAALRYDGVADRELVDKLKIWEEKL